MGANPSHSRVALAWRSHRAAPGSVVVVVVEGACAPQGILYLRRLHVFCEVTGLVSRYLLLTYPWVLLTVWYVPTSPVPAPSPKSKAGMH